jgi:ABC-type microcin C transport system duplicated ATPase subunit YejF
MSATNQRPLLEIERLSVGFRSQNGLNQVMSEIQLELFAGEMLALEGPSGCGKTTLALAILRLLPGTAVADGVIRFKGQDLFQFTQKELREIRGKEIGMVFQEPRAALDPLQTAETHLLQPLRVHRSLAGDRARQQAADLLVEVGFAEPNSVLSRYPHQLSVGECQRVLLAACLAAQPTLLICDEPTSALDGPNRLRILRLLDQLRLRHNLSILLISQDLNLLERFADRIVRFPAVPISSGPREEWKSTL